RIKNIRIFECVPESEEYYQLSEEARVACDKICWHLNDDALHFTYWSRSKDECIKMKEVENNLETNDLVASGCFPSVFEMNSQEDGILAC
ncbi:hypothetical protein PMAYCL1PPCAC_25218, partial [Pristionchus mayeri]